MPEVSVIITTYNAAAYILAALESVLSQTYKDFEIIVIDDGSTDDTRAVLQPYQNRIRYVWQENQDRSVARNNGAHLAAGRFIAFLDADDIWTPDKLEKQVAAFKDFPQAVMTYGCIQIVNEFGTPVVWWGMEIIGDHHSPKQVYHETGQIIMGTSITTFAMILKDSFLETGGFDPDIHYGEDWDFWIRLSRKGPFVKMPDILGFYRTYGIDRELHRRVSDHYVTRSLYIISKNAKEDPDRFPPDLALRSQANIYLQTALASFELHDFQRGRAMFAEGLAKDPSLGTQERLVDIFEHSARRIWRDTHSESTVREFLFGAFKALPAAAEIHGLTPRKVFARALIAEAFSAHSNRDWFSVRQVVWRGFLNDPRWLLNRGVLSIAVHSIFSCGGNRSVICRK